MQKMLIFALLLASGTAGAQNITTFEKTYSTDMMFNEGVAQSHLTTLEGNLRSIRVVNAYVGGLGDGDMVLMNIDSMGNVLNHVNIGVDGYHDVCVSYTEFNKSYYFAGYTRGIDTSASPLFTSFILRTDSGLTTLWQQNFISPQADLIAQAFSRTSGGNFLLAGDLYDFTTSGWSTFLCKLDVNGNVLWARKFTANLGLAVKNVTELQNGDIVVAGSVIIGFQKWLPMVMRFNSTGTLLWANAYHWETVWPQNSQLLHIKELPGSRLLVSGKSDWVGNGLMDMVLFKLQADGTPVWEKAYGGPQLDWTYGSIYDNVTREMIFLGSTSVTNGNAGMMCRVDTAGNLLGAVGVGDTNSSQTITLYNYIRLSSQNYLLTGSHYTTPNLLYTTKLTTTASANCHTFPLNFGTDTVNLPYMPITVNDAALTVMTNSLQLGTHTGYTDSLICIQYATVQVPEEENTPQWNVFPNPTQGFVQLTWPYGIASDWQLTVTDITGRTLLQSPSLQASLDASAWPAGMYTLTLYHYGTGDRHTRMLIKQ